MKRLVILLVLLLFLATESSAKRRWGSRTHSSSCGGTCDPMPVWAIVLLVVLCVFIFGGSFCWWWFVTKEHSCPTCLWFVLACPCWPCLCCWFCFCREDSADKERRKVESEVDKMLNTNIEQELSVNIPSSVLGDVESGAAVNNDQGATTSVQELKDSLKVEETSSVPEDVESTAPASMPPPPSYDLATADVSTPFIVPNQAEPSMLPYPVPTTEQPLYGND